VRVASDEDRPGLFIGQTGMISEGRNSEDDLD